MSNRLPSTRTAQTPSPIEAKIETFHGRLEAHPVHPTRYCVRSDRAVTTAERQALSDVAERLEADLAPWGDRRQVDAVVSRVLLGFELGRGRGDEADEVLIAEYIEALKGLPLRAVQAAAARFRSGDTLLTWNRDFRPSPAKFAAETREGMVAHRTKLLHVRRVLDAEIIHVPTAEEQAKVAEATEAYLKRIPLTDGPGQHRAETPREIQAAREAQLRGQVERLRETGHGPDISRLTEHLNARRAGPQGGSAQT